MSTSGPVVDGRQHITEYLFNKKRASDYWYIDIETDAVKATRIWCAVASNLGTSETVVLRGRDEVKRFVEAHPDVRWVGHNVVSFDVPTINRLCDTRIPTSSCVDTLVMSYLYNPSLPGGHSLEAYGERLGYPKGAFTDFEGGLTEEMITYCRRDVELGIKVYLGLSERMRKVGYSEKSIELEHDIRVVIDKQQINGFSFDQGMAVQLYGSLRLREDDLAEQIRGLFPSTLEEQGTYGYRTKQDGTPFESYQRHLKTYPELRFNKDRSAYKTYDWEPFNLGSPKQRVERLMAIGYKPTQFTPKGQPKVDEDSLLNFAEVSGRSEVKALAEWLVVNGRANMVNTWLNSVDPITGAIHGRVFSCGANSRRMTHSSPNTANIPSNEAKYGTECRSLWRARDGRRLVGYDAKAAQMRCFVHFLPDPEAGRRYWDTELCPDPHQVNADLIGIARKPVKNVFYANMFGAYPPKLAATAGRQGTKKDLETYGKWIQDELYRLTPGLKDLTESAREEFRSNRGRLRCIDGGYVLCPAESAALNYKIQPAEAVLMKTAAVMLDRRISEDGLDAKKVADIHDEAQLDVSPGDAERVGRMATDCIRDAGEALGFRVPTAGDYKIGTNWSETH